MGGLRASWQTRPIRAPRQTIGDLRHVERDCCEPGGLRTALCGIRVQLGDSGLTGRSPRRVCNTGLTRPASHPPATRGSTRGCPWTSRIAFPKVTAEAISRTRTLNGRVIAIGTTVVESTGRCRMGQRQRAGGSRTRPTQNWSRDEAASRRRHPVPGTHESGTSHHDCCVRSFRGECFRAWTSNSMLMDIAPTNSATRSWLSATHYRRRDRKR